ncbi:MAG: hypothetical protein IJ305_01695 [Oscillospiraceae bacterium]|nr:hypothetical protein [Oscillospiraceae bacterium]
MDFTDPDVIQEMFQMEFGTDFVQYSDADGTVTETDTTVEAVPEVDAERTDPDRVYVSKEDVLAAN